MSEAAIRARIKTVLEGVTGIGVVHDRQRFSRSEQTWLEMMVSGGVVNGWEIHRQATPAYWANNQQVERDHQYLITGIYELDDAEDSAATFQALIEGIFAAVRDDPTLNATAMDSDPLQVESVGVEEREGRLYHNCELLLAVQERETYGG